VKTNVSDPLSAALGHRLAVPLQSFLIVGKAGISPKEQPEKTVSEHATNYRLRPAVGGKYGGAEAGTLVSQLGQQWRNPGVMAGRMAIGTAPPNCEG
jgi:hypothetical protein